MLYGIRIAELCRQKHNELTYEYLNNNIKFGICKSIYIFA